MQKLNDTGDQRIKIIHRNGKNISGPLAPKKSMAFSLFNFSRTQTHGKNAAAVLSKPVPEMRHPDTSRAGLAAIKNWVALEEKLVHDYKEQKRVQPKNTVPLPKIPRPDIPRTDLKVIESWIALEEKVVHEYEEQRTARPKIIFPLPKTPKQRSLPVLETFSAQTAVSSLPRAPKLSGPGRAPSEEFFLNLGRILLVLGWLTAGVLAFFYVQETFLSREASQKLLQLKDEKGFLERSYIALKNVLEDERAEMRWVNGELQETTSELKTARSEADVLRNTVQTQKAIIAALKAQSQAFDKIIDQGGMSALSGAAAGVSRERFSTGRTALFQGEVASVNERRGFVVINMGAAQGAYPGRWITISRNGKGLAVGRVDRVYPTMSVAVLRNSGMLHVIQEGDSVFFS